MGRKKGEERILKFAEALARLVLFCVIFFISFFFLSLSTAPSLPLSYVFDATEITSKQARGYVKFKKNKEKNPPLIKLKSSDGYY